VEIIHCGGGNRRFAETAISAGFRYGARLPDTVYAPLYFADQEFKDPDRDAYMAALAEHRPRLATVLDWQKPGQLDEVLGWAEDAARFVDVIVIVPKVVGGIPRLPRTIGGRPVRLGYSVPTRYAGTPVPVWEFTGWPVHLLGGSPQKQMEMTLYLDVRSADSNYAQKMATKYCQFWTPGNARYAKNRYWPTLREADGKRWKGNAPYEAFRRSCANMRAAWDSFLGGEA
jgi:hypothetical protein